MPFAPHLRIAFGGTLSVASANDEIWNCNVNAVPFAGGTMTAINTDTYIEEVQGPLKTWFENAATQIASSARLTYLKANWVGADGKYAYPGTSMHLYSPAGVGGSAATVPGILSLCVSWTSALGRGPGAHGRIYLPNYTAGAPTSMRVVAGVASASAIAGRALLVLLANAVNTQSVYPVIASKVNATNTHITGVKVGDVWDVQRRRKDALKESYQVLAYP